MYVPILTSDRDFAGAWHPATATLDWCEANYTWSYYIAEWWNTLSNVFMIVFGLHGALSILMARGESRFFLSFIALFVVGFGSWLFHMTLSYPMQLVDELSMLFCVALLLYCAFEDKSSYGSANYPLAFGLFSVAVTVSGIYVAIGHPVFHQVTYCLLVALLVYKSARNLAGYPAKYTRMFGFSLAMYVLGLVVWELDVHYCSALRGLRAGPARVAPVLLEMHAWWHIFAGMGTYFLIVIMASTRSESLQRGLHLKMLFGVFPLLVARREERSA